VLIVLFSIAVQCTKGLSRPILTKPEDLPTDVLMMYKKGKSEYMHANIINTKQVISGDLPTNFDGRQQWPTCIHPVLDQAQCGSCWSFAATETLSDRYCIFSMGQKDSVNIVLSPQNLLSCEKLNLGCSMGSLPEWAWSFLTSTGVASMACVPYTSGNGSVPHCQHTCADGSSIKYYKAKNYTHVGSFLEPSRHIESIMQALLQGPVDVTFIVYEDFDEYKGGIYRHTEGKYAGIHSVKVVGYGTENGTDYWLVQNSWGTTFGEKGFFRILRGVNECSIEELVYTGVPDL